MAYNRTYEKRPYVDWRANRKISAYSVYCPACHKKWVICGHKDNFCSDECRAKGYPQKVVLPHTCEFAGCEETKNLTSVKAFGEWEDYCPKHIEHYRMFDTAATAPAYLLDE